MICLLLIMTMIFISSTESAEQKTRHSETLLKEDMNAKTKAWLLMVEAGKVDQEELRRITPKSIFIAPLLTSRLGKCKEGYRHDHLGQCVKVIKIDPKVQLELLLQRLNKLYGEKKEEKEKEAELFQVSSEPLHFSLPISNFDEKPDSDTKLDTRQVSSTSSNITAPKAENLTEFLPIALPMVDLNENNQTKELESSGAGTLNDTEEYEVSQFEGSGDVQVASGDCFQDEKSTTVSFVNLLSEETDYFDVTETESSAATETQTVTEPPAENLAKAPVEEVLSGESYQNITSIPSINYSAQVLPKENIYVQKENGTSDPRKIHFPDDDGDTNDSSSTLMSSSVQNGRIRFPDNVPTPPVSGHPSITDASFKLDRFQVHSSAIPRDHFWWLTKNRKVDDNHKSSMVKVWSRLPISHDITYSREPPENYRKPVPLDKSQTQILFPQERDEEFTLSPNQQQPIHRVVKPFRSSRFQDIVLTPRQNFRFQR